MGKKNLIYHRGKKLGFRKAIAQDLEKIFVKGSLKIVLPDGIVLFWVVEKGGIVAH